MVNRVIEVKRLKMKRKGRHKVWSNVKLNTGPSPGSIAALYRNKMKAPRDIAELAELEGRFPTKQFTVEQIFDLSKGENAYPRAMVLARLWQSEVIKQGVEQHYGVSIFESRKKRIWMYRSGERTWYVQAEFEYIGLELQYVRLSKSVNYMSAERAAFVRKNWAYRWAEVQVVLPHKS